MVKIDFCRCQGHVDQILIQYLISEIRRVAIDETDVRSANIGTTLAFRLTHISVHYHFWHKINCQSIIKNNYYCAIRRLSKMSDYIY